MTLQVLCVWHVIGAFLILSTVVLNRLMRWYDTIMVWHSKQACHALFLWQHTFTTHYAFVLP